MTEVGFGIVRALLVPGARARGGRHRVRPGGVEAGARRRRRLGQRLHAGARGLRPPDAAPAARAAALGAAMSALGLVFQGAIAGGTSLWSALDPEGGGGRAPHALRHGLGPQAAGLGRGRRPARAPRPATLAGGGRRAGRRCSASCASRRRSPGTPRRWTRPGCWCRPTSCTSLAMAVWVGGVALLLLALPSATRVLEPEDRTPVLAGSVSRFSTVALSAVAVLVASGTVQAILDLDAFGDLSAQRLRPRDPRQDRAPGRADRARRVEPSARPPASRRAGGAARDTRRRRGGAAARAASRAGPDAGGALGHRGAGLLRARRWAPPGPRPRTPRWGRRGSS